MDRYEAARALGIADADVLEIAETGRGTEVEVADGGRRLIREDGVYALGEHLATRGLRRWPDAEPAEPAMVDAPSIEADAGGAAAVPDGTAEEVLAWVGADPGRATAALEAEDKRDKPRATLVAKLEKVAG